MSEFFQSMLSNLINAPGANKPSVDELKLLRRKMEQTKRVMTGGNLL